MSADPHFSAMTRREALRKTVLFSSGLFAAGWLGSARAAAPLPTPKASKKGLHFLAMGDFGTGNDSQRAVSKRMAAYAKQLGVPLHAVLALGDNFYRRLTPDRFQTHFEDMYPQADFDCPFYACLGNHDYGPKYDSDQGREKAQMQLDYASNNPASRWKLPNRWYTLELPDAKKPLVRIIVLDGNYAEGALTPQEKLAQQRFLKAELAKKSRAPWQWMITHFPVFSETTKRGDSAKMLELWGPALKNHPFDLYLSGHDHNLQHLQVDGYRSSFIVSGAGGAGLYEVDHVDARGYTQAILGFNHLHVTPDKLQVQFIDSEGRRLHAFERNLKGKVKILT